MIHVIVFYDIADDVVMDITPTSDQFQLFNMMKFNYYNARIFRGAMPMPTTVEKVIGDITYVYVYDQNNEYDEDDFNRKIERAIQVPDLFIDVTPNR